MRKLGNTIKSGDGYQIIELIEVRMDGTPVVIGYNITGPNVDNTWIYDNAQAHAKFDELTQQNKP